MILTDVNVLVYAFREDADRHREYREWVEEMLVSPRAFAWSGLVMSGFLRVVTHPKVFRRPAPLHLALEFVETIRSRPNAVPILPGPRHWQIFAELAARVEARGNLLPDAYLAALAIESGCDWITTDRDYARFPDLRWRHPLAD